MFPAALEIMCILQTLPDVQRRQVKPGKNNRNPDRSQFKQY